MFYNIWLSVKILFLKKIKTKSDSSYEFILIKDIFVPNLHSSFQKFVVTYLWNFKLVACGPNRLI